MSDAPSLYGADYSVYTRIARLVLAEKGIAHAFETVDVFGEKGPPAWYAALHPFRKIPALRHGALTLYETQAIARYLDAAFAGPALTPAAPAAAARMAQLIGIGDSYAYPRLVWGIYVAEKDGSGAASEAREKAERTLDALAPLVEGPYLMGEALTLADLHLAPMLAYLRFAPSGRDLLAARPGLDAWLARMQARESYAATPYPAERD
jgi:glutathione S-transferase